MDPPTDDGKKDKEFPTYPDSGLPFTDHLSSREIPIDLIELINECRDGVESLHSKFEELEGKLDGIAVVQAGVQTAVSGLQNSVVVVKDGVAELQRVAVVQAGVQTAVSGLQNSVAVVQDGVAELQKGVRDLQDGVGGIETTVAWQNRNLLISYTIEGIKLIAVGVALHNIRGFTHEVKPLVKETTGTVKAASKCLESTSNLLNTTSDNMKTVIPGAVKDTGAGALKQLGIFLALNFGLKVLKTLFQ